MIEMYGQTSSSETILSKKHESAYSLFEQGKKRFDMVNTEVLLNNVKSIYFTSLTSVIFESFDDEF